MIALSPNIGYVHEPFNPNISVYRSLFDYWFTYVCDENQSVYYKDISDCLDFKYPFAKDIRTIRSPKDIVRIGRDYLKLKKYRLMGKQALIKDPISIFSAGWLYNTFNMNVIVLMRHPAAFVGSLKKRNATFPFSHFLSQKFLMRDHLSQYREKIEKYTANPPDIIDQGILLWNIIHDVILRYRQKNSHWVYRRHEDLSKNPVDEFCKIYNILGLNYSDTVKNKIEKFSSLDQQKEGIKRDSKANIWSWKRRLTNEQINRVRRGTAKLADEIYTNEDWNL
jgi:hypothetical protein